MHLAIPDQLAPELRDFFLKKAEYYNDLARRCSEPKQRRIKGAEKAGDPFPHVDKVVPKTATVTKTKKKIKKKKNAIDHATVTL